MRTGCDHGQMRLILLVVSLTASAGAQTAFFAHVGVAAGQRLGLGAASLGDTNGDGVPDYVATDVLGGAPRCIAYSGLDGSTLWTFVGATLPTAPGGAAQPIPEVGGPVALGDVNGDGKDDVAFMDSAPAFAGAYPTNVVRCLSGANGSVLWTRSSGTSFGIFFPGVPTLYGGGEDLDGDGISDVLARTTNASFGYVGLDVVSGATGLTIATRLFVSVGTLTPDANGDGFAELAYVSGASSQTVTLESGPALTPLTTFTAPPNEQWAAVSSPGDVTGDGLAEIALSSRSAIPFAPTNSTTLRVGGTWSQLYVLTGAAAVGAGSSIAPLGDVNGDGWPDFALYGVSAAGQGVSLRSGPTGAALLTLPTAPGAAPVIPSRGPDVNLDGAREYFLCEPLADVGAVDNGRFRLLPLVPPPTAATVNLGGATGPAGGALTATPPTLGLSATVAISGAPAAATGLLVLDLGPPAPTALGSGTLFPDLARSASWTVVPVLTDGTGGFSLVVPIPRIPLLAGSTATLQAAIVRAGPLGFDLSNGVRTTLGY